MVPWHDPTVGVAKQLPMSDIKAFVVRSRRLRTTCPAGGRSQIASNSNSSSKANRIRTCSTSERLGPRLEAGFCRASKSPGLLSESE